MSDLEGRGGAAIPLSPETDDSFAIELLTHLAHVVLALNENVDSIGQMGHRLAIRRHRLWATMVAQASAFRCLPPVGQTAPMRLLFPIGIVTGMATEAMYHGPTRSEAYYIEKVAHRYARLIPESLRPRKAPSRRREVGKKSCPSTAASQ